MRPLVVHLCIIGILMKHLSGYGIFLSKNQVYGYKKNSAFQGTKAHFAKGRFRSTDCLYC